MELLLVWKHPITRNRYAIGRLWRDDSGFHFRYEWDMPLSAKHAHHDGFRYLGPFPADESITSSDHLFPIFARRLPPAWRKDEYAKLELTPDQSLEYLRKTGGRLSGDTLEFLEPMDDAAKDLKWAVAQIPPRPTGYE